MTYTIKCINIVFKIILVILPFALALFVTEIITRYYYFGSLSMKNGTPDGQFVRYNEELGWSMIPNSEGYFSNPIVGYNGFVKFDQNGVRVNDNRFSPKGESIIVIGDSTTAGLEVDNNETYVAILEKLFFENGCEYRFYNAGVRGYGTDQSLWNLERLISVVNPKFVIYMFSSSDFLDNRTIKRPNTKYSKPVFIINHNELNVINRPSKIFDTPYYSFVEYSTSGHKVIDGYYKNPIPLIKDFLKRHLAIYYPLRAVSEYFQISPEVKVQENTRYPDLEILESILTNIKSYGVELFITSYPLEEQKLFINDIRDISDKLDIKYLDISPYFTEEPTNYQWTKDGHWNEKGHFQTAYALYELLGHHLCIQ